MDRAQCSGMKYLTTVLHSHASSACKLTGLLPSRVYCLTAFKCLL
jgi:hypothetical protein